MSKELDDFYKKYSARITEMDDMPLVKVMDGGRFKMLSIEEYEEMTNKIADLEAKLAQAKMNESFEKEKKENAWKFIEQLKQQLEEKEKERHEEWKTGKEWKWEWQRANQKLEQANQDKISFAVERLLNVRSFICECTEIKEPDYTKVCDFIDNQIRQLKEMGDGKDV